MILLQFLASAAMIWLAARWLVSASDKIAKITGLGHLFVGSLFLAAATSAPELFVDIEATRRGLPDLAAGDLLGSSLVNLIILCALSLVFWESVDCRMSRQSRLSAGLAAILTAEVGFFIYLQTGLGLPGFSLSGAVLVLTYLVGLRAIFEKPHSAGEPDATKSPKAKLLIRPTVGFISATVLIFFASPYLVTSVEKIAELTGLGNTFLGTSLLAFTTSFPELFASLAAIRAGLFHLVAGNIVGSNCINMLIFAAMEGIWTQGSLWAHLSRNHLLAAGFVILSMVLLGIPKLNYARVWLILIFNLGCYLILYLVSATR
ncbi:MAG TPA: hypothetical protein VFW62_13270 [bacterium]|nr:hypothetical protein [bacterium]